MDSSPFAQHLDTNYIPTSPEIDTIKSMIDTRQLKLDAIDSKLADLDRLRKELEAERNVDTEFITKHYALTTIARTLPDDILSAIFTTLLSVSPPFTSPYPSVILSHVCRRWREISLGMSTLWTNIEVATPKLTFNDDEWYSRWFSNMQATIDRIQTFYGRSGECPLAVRLDIQDPDNAMSKYMMDNGVGQPFEPIVRALCLYMTKEWQTTNVSLKVTPSEPFSIVFPIMLPPLCQKGLGDVQFEFTYVHDGTMDEDALDLMREVNFEGASFTSLTLMMEDDALRSVHADWDTLTTLGIGNRNNSGLLSTDYVLSVLSKTPNLVTFTIEFPRYTYKEAPSPSPTHVSLSKLRSLTIRGVNPPAVLFAHISFPHLKRLSTLCNVHGDDVAPLDGHSVLVYLLQQYGKQLVELVLDCGTVTQSALSFALDRLPNVEALELISYAPPTTWTELPFAEDAKGSPAKLESAIEELIPALNEQRTALAKECPCPNLKELRLGLFAVGPDLKEGIVAFIEARRRVKKADGPIS